MPVDEFEAMLSSGTMETRALQSFSQLRDEAETFAGVHKIDADTITVVIRAEARGKRGVWLDPISSTRGEEEVLFRGRTRFKINSFKRKDMKVQTVDDIKLDGSPDTYSTGYHFEIDVTEL